MQRESVFRHSEKDAGNNGITQQLLRIYHETRFKKNEDTLLEKAVEIAKDSVAKDSGLSPS